MENYNRNATTEQIKIYSKFFGCDKNNGEDLDYARLLRESENDAKDRVNLDVKQKRLETTIEFRKIAKKLCKQIIERRTDFLKIGERVDREKKKYIYISDFFEEVAESGIEISREERKVLLKVIDVKHDVGKIDYELFHRTISQEGMKELRQDEEELKALKRQLGSI